MGLGVFGSLCHVLSCVANCGTALPRSPQALPGCPRRVPKALPSSDVHFVMVIAEQGPRAPMTTALSTLLFKCSSRGPRGWVFSAMDLHL